MAEIQLSDLNSNNPASGGASDDNKFGDNSSSDIPLKLKKAKKTELLAASENDPTGSSIFISYARKDKSFVKSIYDSLNIATDEGTGTGRNIWVDWEDMPPTNDWLDEIHKAIERSDTFLFVVSPEAVKNEVCNYEVDHAVKNGKRIVAIVSRDVDYREVRKEISALNWIVYLSDGSNFTDAMELLLKSIDQDLRHVRYHTKLLCRAIEWERNDFEKSLLLLEDNDLIRAKHWLSASALGKEPKPTTLHLSFIMASDTLNSSMKKRRLIAVFFGIIVAIGIIWPSWGVFFFALVFSHFFVYFSSN